MRVTMIACYLIAAVASITSIGCGSKPAESAAASGSKATAEEQQNHDDHGHDHHEHGPHDGHLIELGHNHQFHAELVEDEQAGTVVIYILDGKLNELPIDQASVVMNLMVEGESKTFELSAAGAVDGRAARFEAADRQLFDALHEHHASGKLRVTIDGKPYSGQVEHSHHEHEHGDDQHDHEHDGEHHEGEHEHEHGDDAHHDGEHEH